MLIDIVLWVTVGLLLAAVGHTWDTWQFWCFLGTYWAVSVLSRQRGNIEGMINFLELSEHDQSQLKQKLKEIKEETK